MNGGFFNEKWAEDAVTERVCDFSRCYDPEEGDTDYYPDCCYGHYANDRMMDISGRFEAYHIIVITIIISIVNFFLACMCFFLSCMYE